MPESTSTLCQSRLYHPVRDFGFGLGYFKVPRYTLLSPQYFPLRGMAFLWVIVANNTAHATWHPSKETGHGWLGVYLQAGLQWREVDELSRNALEVEAEFLGLIIMQNLGISSHTRQYLTISCQLPFWCTTCKVVRIYGLQHLKLISYFSHLSSAWLKKDKSQSLCNISLWCIFYLKLVFTGHVRAVLNMHLL
jgi:hypothetical protein